MISPTAAFSSMLSTFALSGVIGYQARHTHPVAAMPPPHPARWSNYTPWWYSYTPLAVRWSGAS